MGRYLNTSSGACDSPETLDIWNKTGFVVLCDGESLRNCFYANEDEGVAHCYPTDEEGNILPPPFGEELGYVVHEGRVQMFALPDLTSTVEVAKLMGMGTFPSQPPPPRRVAVLKVNADILIQLLVKDLGPSTSGSWISSHGIPLDAKVVGVGSVDKPESGYSFLVYLESASFAPVPCGQTCPEVTLTFQRHENPKPFQSR